EIIYFISWAAALSSNCKKVAEGAPRFDVMKKSWLPRGALRVLKRTDQAIIYYLLQT
ncbi:unnamed protein product, partial [Oikopleura dioica]